jgi:hypothetical protein
MAEADDVSGLRSFTITPRDPTGTSGPVAPVAHALVQAIAGAQVQRLGTLANVATVLIPAPREAEARALLGEAWSLDPNAPLDFGGDAGPGPAA